MGWKCLHSGLYSDPASHRWSCFGLWASTYSIGLCCGLRDRICDLWSCSKLANVHCWSWWVSVSLCREICWNTCSSSYTGDGWRSVPIYHGNYLCWSCPPPRTWKISGDHRIVSRSTIPYHTVSYNLFCCSVWAFAWYGPPSAPKAYFW